YFRPTAQHLGHTPPLGYAAARRERLLGVEHLAHRADTRLMEMFGEPFQETTGPRPVLRVDLEPGVEEGADKPRPDGALVIGRVAGPQVAVIHRLVVGVPRRE